MTWDLFGVNGKIWDEFAKLNKIAFQLNEKTQEEVNTCITKLGLPEHYYSIQFRGGNKILEQTDLLTVDKALEKIEDMNLKIESLFVLSDDYKYVVELKEKRPLWKIYTLTKENESGYNNLDFPKKPWEEKRQEMIKLFAMVKICLESDLHLGNEQTNVNSYIRSLKKEYVSFWADTSDDKVK